jgi:hypothetical protein
MYRRKLVSLNLEVQGIATNRRFPFWRRQFAKDQTQAQQIFDVIFGVIAPVLCFYFDPVVFKSGLVGQMVGDLKAYQMFAYSVAAINVPVLAIWLSFGKRLKRWSSFIGGILVCGSVFSALVGIAILPLTLLGLLLLIGILGFIPFITAFVYFRVGLRAFKCEEKTNQASWALALVIAAILSLGLPALLSFCVSRFVSQSIEIVLHGSPEQAQVALARLRRIPFIPEQDLASLMSAYTVEKNLERKAILKEFFRQLTGDDIDVRIRILND